MHELVFMVTIINSHDEKRAMNILEKIQLPIIVSSIGYGTASDKILDLLGLGETEKTVIFSVQSNSEAQKAISLLEREIKIDIPGNGILFTIPISCVGGAKCAEFMLDSNESEKGNDCMINSEHEVIVVIANRGFSELVMDAAHSAGAGGGTVIHAKGTGVEKAEKFFGVSIADEKEMILMVVKKDKKADIMKAIISEAGMHTKARSMLFSMPAQDIVGLRTGNFEEV